MTDPRQLRTPKRMRFPSHELQDFCPSAGAFAVPTARHNWYCFGRSASFLFFFCFLYIVCASSVRASQSGSCSSLLDPSCHPAAVTSCRVLSFAVKTKLRRDAEPPTTTAAVWSAAATATTYRYRQRRAVLQSEHLLCRAVVRCLSVCDEGRSKMR